ncbi:hypothetical protein [Acinetobacter sp. BMW17]|uniref:hypothetical protein n=1 Tax=Acinetobacter sp. BMW17 TaxID=1795629 RepID=UPI000782036E|nr:hypothetical protein [Acinetobacter sp. BMW17]
MVFGVKVIHSVVERIEDEARMQELHDLFLLIDEEGEPTNTQTIRDVMPGLGMMIDRPGLHEVARVIQAIIEQADVKTEFESIKQLVDSQKLDESERTKQIINRLKREANIFQLIKYSNHLISIFPKLQTTNYIEA